MNNKFLDLLKNINNNKEEVSNFKKHDRVVIIDGLNLFLRNFAMVNHINESGNHTGGLGGFLRSLGSLINLIKPTEVYIIFDGKGSSDTRKNLLPEYKSGRHISRVTNWNTFQNLEEENVAKINQIVRLIHYLKCLPIKVASLDKVEADDIIAYLSNILVQNHDSKVFIVSADQDYLQLVSNNITLYRPVKKEFYTPEKIKEEYGVLAENFILYKTLIGDNSDKIEGIKGLGKKKLFNMFPELLQIPLTLKDIIQISEKKYKEHIIYSRVVSEESYLNKSYKIMDLKNPLMDKKEKDFIESLIKESNIKLDISSFLQLYKEDGLNNQIKDPGFWLKENFNILNSFN